MIGPNPLPKKTEDLYGFPIADGDVVLLEALIQSPVFSALKRTLDVYRKQCYGVLLSSKEPPQLFETQGRIIGANIIENLPGLIVAQRQAKLKKKEKEEAIQKRTRKS